jgi:ribosomal protein L3
MTRIFDLIFWDAMSREFCENPICVKSVKTIRVISVRNKQCPGNTTTRLNAQTKKIMPKAFKIRVIRVIRVPNPSASSQVKIRVIRVIRVPNPSASSQVKIRVIRVIRVPNPSASSQVKIRVIRVPKTNPRHPK